MEQEDFSKKYFERIEQGEESMHFLSISNAIDATFIQSALYSENIPSYVMNTHMSVIYNPWNTNSVIKIPLYILKSDYETAKNILNDFQYSYKGSLHLFNSEGKEEDINIYSKVNQVNSESENTENTEAEETNNENESEPIKPRMQKFFSFEGTCSLKIFWLNVIPFILLSFLRVRSANYIYSTGNPILYILLSLILIVWQIHLFCLAVQRYRDIGNNPWILFIPIWGIIGPLFIPSMKDQSQNKYINYKIKYKGLFIALFVVFELVHILITCNVILTALNYHNYYWY